MALYCSDAERLGFSYPSPDETGFPPYVFCANRAVGHILATTPLTVAAVERDFMNQLAYTGAGARYP
jgi:hypothetical protein